MGLRPAFIEKLNRLSSYTQFLLSAVLNVEQED